MIITKKNVSSSTFKTALRDAVCMFHIIDKNSNAQSFYQKNREKIHSKTMP